MFRSSREDDCAKNVEEFEATALPHLCKLFRIAAWLTQDRVAAETLVQATLSAAFDSLDQLEEKQDACLWLVRIMYETRNKPHHAWWSWRTPRKLASAPDDAPANIATFEPRTPRDVTEEELLSALRGLSPSHQEVILLSDIEELTYKEAAEVLGVTVGVVMMRLMHARKMLRAGLRNRAGGRDETSSDTAHVVAS